MKKAFTLVEVVLALGIISFALLAVVGLLPIGLKSVKNANENAGAANVLQAIAASVRSATTTNSTTFSSRFAGQDISYSIGGPIPPGLEWPDLTLEGIREVNTSSPRRLSARLDIYPSASLIIPSRGVVSVAWSAQAVPVWDANTQRWTKAEGSITSGIQFLPKQ